MRSKIHPKISPAPPVMESYWNRRKIPSVGAIDFFSGKRSAAKQMGFVGIWAGMRHGAVARSAATLSGAA